MSDIKKLWLASHLEILERKARQGASNAVIATEFTFLPRNSNEPNPYIPTEQEIAQKRKDMKLPPENAALAVSSAVLPSSKSVDVPVFHERIDTPAAEKPNTVMPRDATPVNYEEKIATFNARVSQLSENVKTAKPSKPSKQAKSEKASEPVDAAEEFKEVAAKLPPELSIQFKSQMPESYKTGMRYYHPVRGIIQYAGKTKTQTSVGTFEMMKFVAGKETIQISPSKIAAQNIRMLADVAFMDTILDAIGGKLIRKKRPVGRGLMQNKMCIEILSSGDPVKLAGLVYWAFKAPESEKINAVHGDKAIAMLAEEYALLKKIDFEEARKMFVEKSGRPTGADLLKNIESPQYMRRNMNDPSPS